jgi:purine-nucleoside phosphorylase
MILGGDRMNINIVNESVSYIRTRIRVKPELGIILGSGLGAIADNVKERQIIKYCDVPNLPTSTVKGHAGQFVFGNINGKNVLLMQGRFHYYEGNKMEDLSLPIYIMKQLGIEKVVITNAAGGVNVNFKPGDLMLIKDHINFAFNNPLIGRNDDNLCNRFPDMSTVYDKDMLKIAKECSEQLKINVQEGTYLMMTGPSYETPAEIRMVRIFGGDAVGMSTVPEVIAAAHCGMKVLGISCITNMASGILDQPLSHKEVMETSEMVKDKFIAFLNEIIKRI